VTELAQGEIGHGAGSVWEGEMRWGKKNKLDAGN
jgi:hypothetical protein